MKKSVQNVLVKRGLPPCMMLIGACISEFSITFNPAESVGMDGTIGSIEIGKCADLLVVSEQMGIPVVTRTIVGGDVVYAADGVS
jgi:urease alpha subunit